MATNETATTKDQNHKEYERLINDIANFTNVISMYPSGHPMIERQLQNLHQRITAFAQTNSRGLDIHRGEGVMLLNDVELLVRDSVLLKLNRHFDDFKITDLEISSEVTAEELRNFFEIFAHSAESAQMYPNLNIACQRNSIAHIKSLQATYIRVPKDVKDKLGGKAVGELKLSQPEMNRLLSYLKGEINLEQPKETKIYKKIFENADLLAGLVDKIIAESGNQPPEKRKELLMVAINRIGDYLIRDATSSVKQKNSIKILSTLEKTLTKSPAFTTLDDSTGLEKEVDQVVTKIKLQIQNQALFAEYERYQDKIKNLEEKLQEVSPNFSAEHVSLPSAISSLLTEIKILLERISQTKMLDENDLKKIIQLLEKLDSLPPKITDGNSIES